MWFKNKSGDGLVKSVFIAYLVLLLHVVLLAGIGLLIILFRGFVSYMLWIFLGFAVVVAVSAYRLYRSIKAQGRTLRETLRSPTFNGRPVEISFLGGLASFRVGSPVDGRPLIEAGNGGPYQLEDPTSMRIRELNSLAKLLEENLITAEEYDRIKKKLFNS